MMPKGKYQHKPTQGFKKGYVPWNKGKKKVIVIPEQIPNVVDEPKPEKKSIFDENGHLISDYEYWRKFPKEIADIEKKDSPYEPKYGGK
jgi:hypothetical protein